MSVRRLGPSFSEIVQRSIQLERSLGAHGAIAPRDGFSITPTRSLAVMAGRTPNPDANMHAAQRLATSLLGAPRNFFDRIVTWEKGSNPELHLLRSQAWHRWREELPLGSLTPLITRALHTQWRIMSWLKHPPTQWRAIFDAQILKRLYGIRLSRWTYDIETHSLVTQVVDRIRNNAPLAWRQADIVFRDRVALPLLDKLATQRSTTVQPLKFEEAVTGVAAFFPEVARANVATALQRGHARNTRGHYSLPQPTPNAENDVVHLSYASARPGYALATLIITPIAVPKGDDGVQHRIAVRRSS